MIRIVDLEINNYRSCIKTRFHLDQNLTALIGINGVGKSNILNSLQLLKKINGNKLLSIKKVPELFSFTKLKIGFIFNKLEYQVKADLYYDTDEKNSDEVYAGKLSIKEKKARSFKNFRPHVVEVYERQRRFGRHFRMNVHRASLGFQVQFKVLEYLTSISYYSATQFSDPNKCPISIDAEPMIRINRQPHEKFIYDLYNSFKNDKKGFTRYLETVNHKGIGLLSDIKFFEHNMPSSSFEIKSGGKIKTIERVKSIAIPSFILDESVLSPNQLSEGTFKTLALIFYIMNDESQLLMIEEPEVCVHHGLLASIIELIKIYSKKKQIIISTHSDYVLDKLSPENILIVTRKSKEGTSAQSLTNSLSKNDYSALKEYLNNSGNLGEYWKEGGFEND